MLRPDHRSLRDRKRHLETSLSVSLEKSNLLHSSAANPVSHDPVNHALLNNLLKTSGESITRNSTSHQHAINFKVELFITVLISNKYLIRQIHTQMYPQPPITHQAIRRGITHQIMSIQLLSTRPGSHINPIGQGIIIITRGD